MTLHDSISIIDEIKVTIQAITITIHYIYYNIIYSCFKYASTSAHYLRPRL